MRPRADQAQFGTGQACQHAEDGVGIAIGPAADGKDGTVDVVVIFADRTMLPEGIAALVRNPRFDMGWRLFQPFQPDAFPVVAHHVGIGRAAIVGKHNRRPPEHIRGQQTAAHVVDIVGIAVIGGAESNDRFECRWPSGRHLQRIEAAPRFAEHTHIAVAPGLRGQPGDHFQRVVLFLFQILIIEDAVGVAAAPHIDTDGSIAMPGKIGVADRVAQGGEVILAIGDVFEQRRDWIARRILW